MVVLKSSQVHISSSLIRSWSFCVGMSFHCSALESSCLFHKTCPVFAIVVFQGLLALVVWGPWTSFHFVLFLSLFMKADSVLTTILFTILQSFYEFIRDHIIRQKPYPEISLR